MPRGHSKTEARVAPADLLETSLPRWAAPASLVPWHSPGALKSADFSATLLCSKRLAPFRNQTYNGDVFRAAGRPRSF